MKTIEFALQVKPPFILKLTVWALQRRSNNPVDSWNGEKYTRVLVVENVPVKVDVSQKRNRVLVLAKSKSIVPNLKVKLTTLLNDMLGLKIDLAEFYRLSEQDKALRPLICKFKGLKPTRFPSLFETLTNAIAFQQISLEAGFSVLNNLVNHYGLAFEDAEKTFHAFPEPARIMKCKVVELMKLGFSRRKSESLISFASQVEHQKIDFYSLEALSDENIVGFLCTFKGLGRWSAEYALLRGFGRLNVLPGDDVGVHRSLKELLHLHTEAGYEKVKELQQKWYPFAGFVYFHFLLHKLEEKGIL